MKEIHISTRRLILSCLLAVLTAGLIFAAERYLPQKGDAEAVSVTAEDPASRAACDAVRAFYTIDYREGQAAWLDRVCALSTQAGCQLLSLGADALWAEYASSRAVVSAEVQALEKVAETASEQVWLVSIHLDQALPGGDSTRDTAYIAVQQTEEGWKFDRFLLSQEITALRGSTLPGTPAYRQGR